MYLLPALMKVGAVAFDNVHRAPAVVGLHGDAIVDHPPPLRAEQEDLHLATLTDHMDMRRIVIIDIDHEPHPGFSVDDDYGP